MFCFHDDDFFDCISNMTKPLHIRVMGDESEDLDKSYIHRLNNALSKNTRSTSLKFTFGCGGGLDVFFNELCVPPNIKILEFSYIDLIYPNRFLLPCDIVEITLNDFVEIFKIDFSNNNNLKIIKINCRPDYNNGTVCIPNDYENKYFSSNIDLSHIHSLEEIHILTYYNRNDHEKNMMKNIKLPYGCKTTFNHRYDKK